MRRLLVCAAVLSMMMLATSAPAQADTYPGTLFPDSGTHTYCYTGTFTTDRSVGSYAMWVLDATTDMSRAYNSSCSNSTDVWFWEANLPGGIRGQWSCYSRFLAWCFTADVTLDFPALDVGANDWQDRRKTAVHEVGHSVGLNHDTVSAMRSGEIPSTALQWRRYSTHDRSHINAWF